jgi:metal-responsive CopG/Arc/MetJ family transcriptional regulator
MKRTQIYISQGMQEELERLSKKRNTSKSEIIREAVTEYISRHSAEEREKKLKAGAGMWKGKKDLPDVSKLRKEFDRLH